MTRDRIYLVFSKKYVLMILFDSMGVIAVVSTLAGYVCMFQGSNLYGVNLLVLSLFCICILTLDKIHMLEQKFKEEYDHSSDNEEEETEQDEETEQEEETEQDEETEQEEEHVEDEETEQEEEQEDEDEEEEEEELHYCGEETCSRMITGDMIAGLCAGCNLVYYCNSDCQKLDWNSGHKLVCNPKPSEVNEPEVLEVPEEVPEQVVTELPSLTPIAV